jgi:hypothetical protein
MSRRLLPPRYCLAGSCEVEDDCDVEADWSVVEVDPTSVDDWLALVELPTVWSPVELTCTPGLTLAAALRSVLLMPTFASTPTLGFTLRLGDVDEVAPLVVALGCMPDVAPDWVPDVAPDCVPEALPDGALEVEPDCAPDSVPDVLPDNVPDVLLEVLGDVDCVVPLTALLEVLGEVDRFVELLKVLGEVDRFVELLEALGEVDRFVELLELLGATSMLVLLLELLGVTPMFVLLLDVLGVTPMVVELDEVPGATRVVESTAPGTTTAPVVYAGEREFQSGMQSSGFMLLIEAQCGTDCANAAPIAPTSDVARSVRLSLSVTVLPPCICAFVGLPRCRGGCGTARDRGMG